MSIIYAAGLKPVKYPNSHDPNEAKYYTFVWRPRTRDDSTEYLLDEIVVPLVPNGFCYACVNPGISAVAEPLLSTTIDGLTTDGTVKWKAIGYNLNLRTGDNITGSTWFGDTDVVTDLDNFTTGQTWARVTGVPAGASKFTLTNRVTIQRATGFIEQLDRSIIVPIKPL